MTNHDLQSLLQLDRSLLPPDGGPEFNRLIFSQSPYLLQHAKNPVDWREWGPEAREEAKRRNLPLFVSIGYATCHWCHVMAHESFEDEEVADILNHAFVPVKVDREERPDLDEFSMAACQALTGSGGWPLNCFLKPDATPFYALTYLPKEPRRGVPGFLELLENIAAVWQHKPDAVERNAQSLMEALGRLAAPEPPEQPASWRKLADQATATLQRIYDRQQAGFGSAPKFPMPPYLLFLLHREAESDRRMALETLQALRRGGIWDHLAGGIHRYSTDRHWLVPHFEKMLYDQALLAYAALEAYAVTADAGYLEMADSLLEFVLEELTAPQGGFYCGLDADSEGREGAYYVWQLREIEELLGQDAPLFCEAFGVTAAGNFEEPGENILSQALSVAELAQRHALSEPEAAARIAAVRQRLLTARRKRIAPLRDEKILAGWNGLMIAALGKGAALTGNQRWLEAAYTAREFISRTLVAADGRLMRSSLKTTSHIKGFLDDYAWLAWGCLELFIARTDQGLLDHAVRLCGDALRLFRRDDGRLTTSGNDTEQLPLALPDLHDGVVPSGTAVLVMDLYRLAQLTGEPYWQGAADKLAEQLRPHFQHSPVSGLWLLDTLHTAKLA